MLHAATQSLERVSANFEIEMSRKTIFVIGIVFTVAGVGLWIFTGVNILMREQTLNDGNFSVEERWSIEGSLQWWRDSSARLLYPLAAVLFIAGLVMVAISLIDRTEIVVLTKSK
jgi:hypothetical protein